MKQLPNDSRQHLRKNEKKMGFYSLLSTLKEVLDGKKTSNPIVSNSDDPGGGMIRICL